MSYESVPNPAGRWLKRNRGRTAARGHSQFTLKPALGNCWPLPPAQYWGSDLAGGKIDPLVASMIQNMSGVQKMSDGK